MKALPHHYEAHLTCSHGDVMAAIARGFMLHVDANVPSVGITDSLRRVSSCVGRFLCGLSGHEMLRQFEKDRVSLGCVRCGAQTPGWKIDVNPAFRRRTEPVLTRGGAIEERSRPKAA